MEKTIARLGFIGLSLLMAAALASAWLALSAGMASALGAAAWTGLGFLVSLLAWMRVQLQNREKWERMESQGDLGERSGSALFEDEGGDTLLARRTRRQFDRYFVPGATALLFLGQALAVWALWGRLGEASRPDPAQAGLAMAAFASFALVLYLLGRYTAGMSRLREGELLRAPSAHLLMGSVVSLLLVAAAAGSWAGIPALDLWTGRILLVLLGLSAAECLVQLVLEAYRPRGSRDPGRPLYESRLVGLLGQPGGLITTLAQALDYQFGFRVSETWFYRFLERSLAWILLLQAAMLLLFTTFVILEPGQQGTLERFGRQVSSRGILGPGIHFKLPWPVDRVLRQPVETVRTLSVGWIPDESRALEEVLLWTVPHNQVEDNFLVASSEGQSEGDEAVPVNFLTASIPVQYRIGDLEQWMYRHQDPEALLESICYREVVRYLVSVDLIGFMSTGRQQGARDLARSIQRAADEAALGVDVLFVGLQDIHPPIGNEQVKVAEAFEEVIGAFQEKETSKLAAEGDMEEALPLARAEALRLTSDARARSAERVEAARSSARQFGRWMDASRSAPGVFANRKYYEALGLSLTNSRKYVVVPRTAEQIFQIDLEDTIAYDLLQARPEER